MTKIILGFEKIDTVNYTGWNFNGRIDSKNQVLNPIEIVKSVGSSMDDWHVHNYKLLIEPEKYSYTPPFPTGLLSSPEVECKCVDDIKDETYFYIINIFTAWIFLYHTKYLAISEKVRNDVKNGTAYIVFIYENEGNLRIVKPGNTLDDLIRGLDLPKDRVYLIHGDFDKDYYSSSPFKYVPINAFPFWLKHREKSEIINYNPDKLFLSYNRMPRTHRLLLLTLLNRHNLIDKGVVSLGNVTDATLHNFQNYHYPEAQTSASDLSFLKSISNTSPDGRNLVSENPAPEITEDHYPTTFVSLVTETLTKGLFFSEKIYKPVLIGHPFILIGAKNQLAKFKEFGFKTFSQWWDESYDNLDSEYERIEKAVRIVVELNKKSSEELIQIRKEMTPILVHNQQLFNKIINSDTNTGYTDKPIKDILSDILKGSNV